MCHDPHGHVTPRITVFTGCVVPTDECVMTRMAMLLVRFFYKVWIFGAAFYWASWVFIAVSSTAVSIINPQDKASENQVVLAECWVVLAECHVVLTKCQIASAECHAVFAECRVCLLWWFCCSND